MFIKTICHAEQERRNGSIKSCHTQPGEMTPGMNGSRPRGPAQKSLELGPRGTSQLEPQPWVWPRKRTLTKTLKTGNTQPESFLWFSLPFEEKSSQDSHRKESGQSDGCALAGVTTGGHAEGSPCWLEQSQTCQGCTGTVGQRLSTKGLGRSLIKGALFSLGVLIGYYQIYFIPNLCSLARQRKGRVEGSERSKSLRLVNNTPFPQSNYPRRRGTGRWEERGSSSPCI